MASRLSVRLVVPRRIPRLSLYAAAVAGWFCAAAVRTAYADPIPLTPRAVASGAQISTSQGIEFVTIGATGNAAWQGNGTQGDRAIGRGSVPYEYRIGRMEVTTAQWVEFFNAAFDRPVSERLPNLIPPQFWGGVGTAPTVPGGLRWRVPAGAELRPVTQIDWRMSAMYCNWLHNDKRTDRDAFFNGAYDILTFTYTGDVFNDQPAHNPDARFWIPTWDEWLKAAHFDPNRDGAGQAGYWVYSTSSNIRPIGGPPPSLGGTGEANYGWLGAGNIAYGVLLGSYPTVQSPWGLLDVSGAAMEWTESIRTDNIGVRYRVVDGSMYGSTQFFGLADTIGAAGADFPSFSLTDYGFRIASRVPAPSTAFVAMVLVIPLVQRKRRPTCTHSQEESLP